VLEPIFEADLQPEQYAYRADRSALDAVRHVHKLMNTGHSKIVDADLSSYFNAELMRSVARRIVDGAMLHLIKMWLTLAKSPAKLKPVMPEILENIDSNLTLPCATSSPPLDGVEEPGLTDQGI
jgi:RNA-directed DNA polymerase